MKKKRGLIFVGIIIAIVVALAFFAEGIGYLVDTALNPWAHSLTGQPTLTGRWRGQLHFAGRTSREMFLEIRRDPREGYGTRRRSRRGRFGRQGAFTGTAQMPDEGGTLINYEIWGRSNYDGSQINIQLRDLNRQPAPKEQPLLQLLRGSWNGTTLQLNGQYSLHVYDGHGSTYEAGAPTPPVTGTLKRE